MLNVLIPHIDTTLETLKYFSQLKGLAEIVSDNSDEQPKSFPAVFIGNGNYDQIELENQVCYHRIAGEKKIEATEEETVGCSKAIMITYPMMLVGCINKTAIPNYCEQYKDDLISNTVGFTLETISFKSVKSQIKAYDIDLSIKSITSDKAQIWGDEYTNIEFQADYDTCYFKIEYELQIKAQTNCLNIIEC